MASDQPETNGTNGDSPNRATVALVSEQVRSLSELTRAEFKSVQRQLDGVAGLPAIVVRLQADLAALDKREVETDNVMDRRVTALEAGRANDSNYRRIHLPTIILSCVIALGTIVTVITQLH